MGYGIWAICQAVTDKRARDDLASIWDLAKDELSGEDLEQARDALVTLADLFGVNDPTLGDE